MVDRSMIRTSIAVAAATAFAFCSAACSSSDSGGTAAPTSTASTTATPTSSASTSTAVAAPAPEVLQKSLEVIADPATTPADKAAVVVDGTAKTALFEALNGALAHYPLTFTIADIRTQGTTTTATATITGPHGGAPVPESWEYTDGAWKLSTASLCSLAQLARLTC